MLTSLKIENFRSIESADIRFGPISVLFGPTSAGKSSLFYSLLALRNFVLNPNQASDAFFNLGFQNLGGFEACVFNHNPSKIISVTADFGEGVGRYGVELAKAEAEIVLSADSTRLSAKVPIPYNLSQSWTTLISESAGPTAEEYTVNWNGFASTVAPKQATAQSQARAVEIAKALNASVEALKRVDICPHRRGFFKPTYTAVALTPTPTTEDEVATLMINDQNAPPRISINTTEIFDRDFRTHTAPGTATTFLKTTELSGARVPGDLVNDGFGVNQIVYLLAKIHRPEARTIFIEEPEVHLHPSVIRKLAQTLCRLAKDEEKQMIMTTHSEQLVLALLACVKQGLIQPDELVCYQVARDRKRTLFERRHVSSDGQIEGGLSSFLDGELEDIKTLLAIPA